MQEPTDIFDGRRWIWLSAAGVGVALLLGALLIGLGVLGGSPQGAEEPAQGAPSALSTEPNSDPVSEDVADAGPNIDVDQASGGGNESTDADAMGDTSLDAQDKLAGLLSRDVPQSGSGRMERVQGAASQPVEAGRRVVRIGFKIESGLNVDSTAFASFVLATLNDPRSWAHDNYQFVDAGTGAARLTVNLATPDTSARMCLPLKTGGKLSCRAGSNVVFTLYRWVNGIPEYGTDLTGYREYLVNHEVGHFLGQGHKYCSSPGSPAPVMQQQTKGLQGCRPNSWPYPD